MMRCSGALLGGLRGEELGGLPANLTDAGWVLKLAGGLLETEVERFVLQIAEADGEFLSGELLDVFCFGFGHGTDDVGVAGRRTDQACGLRVTRRVRRPSL